MISKTETIICNLSRRLGEELVLFEILKLMEKSDDGKIAIRDIKHLLNKDSLV